MMDGGSDQIVRFISVKVGWFSTSYFAIGVLC